jgi:hypothetical protein
MAQSPEYAQQIRVAAFGQKKDLYGKTKDESMEFEDYVNGVGEDGPVIQQTDSNPLPPMSAMDRIHQKLGTGSFAPQTVQPTNTEPLPGSPGAGPEDRAALTRMIDNESEEMDEACGDTAMDRISARVASRDGETTPMERVSERVATRTSAGTVNEKAVTNEALDTMLWLSGVKKKSEVAEAAPDWDANVGFDDWAKANGPQTPNADTAPKVELPKAGPDVAPKVELPKGPAATAPEVELTKPKFNYSPIDNKFTQLPDKGFSPAPAIEPPTTGFSGSSDAPKITQNNVTREPPQTTRIQPPTIEPPTKTPTVQTGVAPEITVSNGDRLPTPEPAPNYVGKFLSKAGGIAAVGSALFNPNDPIASAIGLGQKSPSAADDEMSPQKGFALSQPSGTITNPERGFNQSNNMQQPAQYSPDMVSTDRIRDLAGIGRK